MSCIFCKIVKGEIPSKKQYEDEQTIAINDINPQAPVHLLVIPKRHALDITETDEVMIGKLFAVAKKLIAEKNIQAHRIVINGRGAQIIEHLHIHVMGGIDKERKL